MCTLAPNNYIFFKFYTAVARDKLLCLHSKYCYIRRVVIRFNRANLRFNHICRTDAIQLTNTSWFHRRQTIRTF